MDGEPGQLLNFTNEPTDNKHLFRVLDRKGDWTHYFQDEANRYLPAVNHIIGIGFPKGMGLINWIKRMTEEESEKLLKSAGERGSKVHAGIRDLISGLQVVYGLNGYKNEDGSWGPLSPDEWDYLLSWDAWAQVFKPQVLKHETAVWNKKYGYAGTVDFIGTIAIPAGSRLYINDKLNTIKEEKTISVLADWKTGSAIYDDYRLQVAAYAACLKIKPKNEFYTAVVRIGTKHQNGGYEMRLWDREQTLYHFKRFLEAKNQFHFINGNKDWSPEIVQIPTALAINIPKIQSIKMRGFQKNHTPWNKGKKMPQNQNNKYAFKGNQAGKTQINTEPKNYSGLPNLVNYVVQ